jgi:hypothetical protein
MFTKEFNEAKEKRYLLELIMRKEFYKDMPDLLKELNSMIKDQKEYIEDNKQ